MAPIPWGAGISRYNTDDTKQANNYWSSTEYNGTNAWNMNFNNGVTNNNNKSNNRYVRPVLAYRNSTYRSDAVFFCNR
ncbi:MAG: hypothetical protein J6I61_10525 [Prevotella sp.]|nr:hypothetical protein [Prevotella sp.]